MWPAGRNELMQSICTKMEYQHREAWDLFQYTNYISGCKQYHHNDMIIGQLSHIPECTSSISHNAAFRTEMCTFLFWMVHCGIWNRCILGFVRLLYCETSLSLREFLLCFGAPFIRTTDATTVETLYSTIYYSKYFIELNFDKSTQYVALWTHKRHPIPRPFGRAMECLLWVFQQKLTVL